MFMSLKRLRLIQQAEQRGANRNDKFKEDDHKHDNKYHDSKQESKGGDR